MSGGLLVITAHPDDEVLIAGGTLAACAAQGIPTAVVCLTRGENGPIADSALATRESLPRVRLAELQAACALLGVGFVKCYRREDGGLRWSDRSGIAAQLTRLIDALQPEVVVSFGEDGLYWHDDHIATFELSRMAVQKAAQPPALFRALWAKSDLRALAAELRQRRLPEDLWGLELEDFGVDDEDRGDEVVVDVRRFAARKLEALYVHRTQLEPGHALLTLPEDLAERFLGYERFAAVEPPGQAAPCPELFADLAAQAVARA